MSFFLHLHCFCQVLNSSVRPPFYLISFYVSYKQKKYKLSVGIVCLYMYVCIYLVYTYHIILHTKEWIQSPTRGTKMTYVQSYYVYVVLFLRKKNIYLVFCTECQSIVQSVSAYKNCHVVMTRKTDGCCCFVDSVKYYFQKYYYYYILTIGSICYF